MANEIGTVAAMIIGLIMAGVVAGVLITNANTDAILGSSTTQVTATTNVVLIAFTILGVGLIAVAGKMIINIFQ